MTTLHKYTENYQRCEKKCVMGLALRDVFTASANMHVTTNYFIVQTGDCEYKLSEMVKNYMQGCFTTHGEHPTDFREIINSRMIYPRR